MTGTLPAANIVTMVGHAPFAFGKGGSMKLCFPLPPLLVLLFVGSALMAGCGMTNCVAHGSMVSTPSGAKPIESLQIGDEVTSIAADGRIDVSVVRNIQSARVRKVHRLTFEDGRTLDVTAEHPVRVGDRWINAGLIEPSSEVFTDGGPGRLTSNKKVFRETTVYDLTVEPDETFLANGILVHNKSVPRPPTYEDMAGPWIMRGVDSIWYRFDLNPDGTGTAGFTTWNVVWNEGVRYEFKPIELVAWR